MIGGTGGNRRGGSWPRSSSSAAIIRRCLRWFVLLAALLGPVVVGCRPARVPVLLPLREASDRTAVVVIPGITGTQLRDRASGRVVWGNTRSLFLPRDGGYGLALPIDETAPETGRLEAFAPILELRFPGGFKKQVYGPLVRLLERNGYRLGRLQAPRPDENLFFLDYDWRLGVEAGARELTRQLESLRRERGEERIRVTLICQSDAARIARYFLRHGDATLERAETGRSRPPPGIEVDKLILVGASNGGALRVLREMNRGRSYVRPFGRRWLPEALFTIPALYEGLPVYARDLFIDAAGEPLEVDPFDAPNWQRYGWSIFAPGAEKRLSRLGRGGLFGDEQTRLDFLERMLDRASRLHGLLAVDPPGFEPPRYYSVQNAYRRSLRRAVLLKDDDAWRTLFAGDRKVDGDPFLLALATAPGDGHATLDSQNWLSPRERAALVRPLVYLDGGHFEIILEPATQRRILQFLLDEPG